MICLYPLSKYIVSFDFYHWLLQMKARGCTEVVFDASKPKKTIWDPATVRRRYETILWPGPALAGLPCREGKDGVDVLDPHQPHLVRFIREGGKVEPLRTVLPARDVKYTVTLRTTQREAHRNSDESLWRAFAAEIGATVIEDYERQPMHLHERVALYAGARMNYFVPNGPAFLCTFTPYPVAMFGLDADAATLQGNGIAPGSERFPWCFGEQHLIWAPPTASGLRAFHERVA